MLIDSLARCIHLFIIYSFIIDIFPLPAVYRLFQNPNMMAVSTIAIYMWVSLLVVYLQPEAAEITTNFTNKMA